MSPVLLEHLLALAAESLMLGVWLSAPPVLAAFVVGVVTGAGQAATQIQDPAIGAAPRLVAVYGSLLLAAPWIGAQALTLTETALRTIALV
jgi:type III secretory pathway component EscS